MKDINSKLTIALHLKDEYNKDSVEVIDLKNDIKENLPNIDYLYKTKQESLEDVRTRDPELAKILEQWENPLPETIILSNTELEQYKELNQIIKSKLFILSNVKEWDKDYLSDYTSQYNRIRGITEWIIKLKVWLYIIICVFIFSIAVITYSIIWNFIHFFRDEIAITRLVWGSKFFIYGPFSLQGMIYCLISFIFSILFFLLLVQNSKSLYENHYSLDILLKDVYYVLWLELAVFIFIWWFSGFLSSKRYLK